MHQVKSERGTGAEAQASLQAGIQNGIDAEIQAEITVCENYLKSPSPFPDLDPLTPDKVSVWCKNYLEHGGAKPYFKGAEEFWEWARSFMNDNASFLTHLIKAATILKSESLLKACGQKACSLIEEEKPCVLTEFPQEVQDKIAMWLTPNLLHKSVKKGILSISEAVEQHNNLWIRIWKSDDALKAATRAGAVPILFGNLRSLGPSMYVGMASLDYTGDLGYYLPNPSDNYNVRPYLQDHVQGRHYEEVVIKPDSTTGSETITVNLTGWNPERDSTDADLGRLISKTESMEIPYLYLSYLNVANFFPTPVSQNDSPMEIWCAKALNPMNNQFIRWTCFEESSISKAGDTGAGNVRGQDSPNHHQTEMAGSSTKQSGKMDDTTSQSVGAIGEPDTEPRDATHEPNERLSSSAETEAKQASTAESPEENKADTVKDIQVIEANAGKSSSEERPSSEAP